MSDKPPYQLTFKFNTARPDALGEALAQLREITSEHDQSAESTATVTIESFTEAPLREIRETFEVWLHEFRIGLECEVKMKAPGLRPETIAALRATKTTPMDQAGWAKVEEVDEPIITPLPYVALLEAPVIEAEVIEKRDEHEQRLAAEEVEA